MNITKEKLEIIKKEAAIFYKKIGSVHCPFLNRKVNFNIQGLGHIQKKEWNKPRHVNDQYLRLKFINLAPVIIGSSGTLQELQKTKNFERVRVNSRWEKHLKNVKYYGFIAIVNEIRVKVIIKEIEGGQPFFWSLIPFWRIKKDRVNNKIKKVFHLGRLEID